MQNAETVLDVIGKRGERGLPVERLYRQMFNPQLYLMAYGKLYSNAGAMTPGVTEKPWTACPWPRSRRSSARCAVSVTGGGQ